VYEAFPAPLLSLPARNFWRRSLFTFSNDLSFCFFIFCSHSVKNPSRFLYNRVLGRLCLFLWQRFRSANVIFFFFLIAFPLPLAPVLLPLDCPLSIAVEDAFLFPCARASLPFRPTRDSERWLGRPPMVRVEGIWPFSIVFVFPGLCFSRTLSHGQYAFARF